MLVMYVIYLLISLFAIELLVVQQEHSREQRLLPLTLGLICLYMFYLIVENITGATDIFRLLKYLLLLQVSYLTFFYILDFCSIKFPMWANITAFSLLGIADVLVVVFMDRLALFKIIVIGVCIFVLICVLTVATKEIVKRSKLRHIHNVYKILYAAIFFPFIALILIMSGLVSDSIVMPSSLMVFVIAVIYLMISGQFYETNKYVMEDLFRNIDEMMFVFDRDFCFIDATEAAKIKFSELVSEMEADRMGFPQRQKMVSWVERGGRSLKYSLKGKYYKIQITEVMRKEKLNGYIVTVNDISTEMAEIENAQEQTRLKSEFLANMSHELRSPLHAIIGGSELILSNNEVTVKNRAMVSSIRNAGNSLLEIVNSILDYSKIEAGKVKLLNDRYDLKEVLESHALGASMLLKEKPIDFRIVVDETVPRFVIGDKNRVHIIIQNLISNAIKYTESGHIELRVKATPSRMDECVLSLDIEDTGIGMSEEQIENAFKRYTTYGNKVSESTGIGLFLVKELCENMGGSVSVKSEKGKGTTFYVKIKQQTEADTTYESYVLDRNILKETRIEGIQNFTPKYVYPEAKVLVVDDMKVNREIFIGKAYAFKMNVSEAESGKAAIEMVKKDSYDLIIMDQMMPEMDGLEASDIIHELTDTPIALLTANISDNMVKQCELHGIGSYLTKPLGLGQLENVLMLLLPKELRKEPESEISIQGAAKMDSNDPAYRYVLEAFLEDIEEIAPSLNEMFENDLDTFRVKVHGIKGSARQIGHENIANEAEIFEMAAKSQHIDYIRRYLDSFILDLSLEMSEVQNELKSLVK